MYQNLFIDFANSKPALCGIAIPIGDYSSFFAPYTANLIELVDAQTDEVVHSNPVYKTENAEGDIKQYTVNGYNSMHCEIEEGVRADIADEYKGRCLYLRDKGMNTADISSKVTLALETIKTLWNADIPEQIIEDFDDYIDLLNENYGSYAQYEHDIEQGVTIGIARGKMLITSSKRTADLSVKGWGGLYPSADYLKINPSLVLGDASSFNLEALYNINRIIQTYIVIDGGEPINITNSTDPILIPIGTPFEFYQIIWGHYNYHYYGDNNSNDWTVYRGDPDGSDLYHTPFTNSYACNLLSTPQTITYTHSFYSTLLFFPKDNDLHNYKQISYRNSKPAFGIPFDETTSLVVLLPIQVTQTQYKQNDETYEDYNGKTRILYSEITEELTMQTEYADAEWHKKMIIALSCDYFQIGTTYYFKSDEYSIDWGSTINDECMGKLAPATFKLKRQQTDRNSACW